MPNNPSAFPQKMNEYQTGMTLRDYFAGQALIGILSAGGCLGHLDGQGDEVENSALAGRYADAMLAEREKVK